MTQGWLFPVLRRTIPGVRFNHRTLWALHELGCVAAHDKRNLFWELTELGRLVVSEMHMNGDGRVYMAGAAQIEGDRPYSVARWEKKQ